MSPLERSWYVALACVVVFVGVLYLQYVFQKH